MCHEISARLLEKHADYLYRVSIMNLMVNCLNTGKLTPGDIREIAVHEVRLLEEDHKQIDDYLAFWENLPDQTPSPYFDRSDPEQNTVFIGLPEDMQNMTLCLPRTCYRTRGHIGHFVIVGLGRSPLTQIPGVAIGQARDSTMPGGMFFAIEREELLICNCGRVELPTEEQAEETCAKSMALNISDMEELIADLRSKVQPGKGIPTGATPKQKMSPASSSKITRFRD